MYSPTKRRDGNGEEKRKGWEYWKGREEKRRKRRIGKRMGEERRSGEEREEERRKIDQKNRRV